MRNAKLIFLREFRSYFNSATAYIVLIVFLTLTGWFFAQGLFLMKQASISGFLNMTPLLFLFLIPAVAMRVLAEEQRLGTAEILSTLPIKDYEIILGKFLAVLALIVIGILCTLIYPITTQFLGKLDWGQVFASYIGLILLAAFFVAIGVFASSLTSSQVGAFIISIFICFLFFIIGKILMVIPTPFVSLIEYLGIDYHYNSITRGVIDSRNIIYFLSMAFFFLSFAFYFFRRTKGILLKGGSIGIILGIIIVLNFLSYRIFKRLDLTEGHIYSLSRASVKLIRKLEDPVIIKGYITKNLPSPYNTHAKYVTDLLSEYKAQSKGRIKFEIIHPKDRETMLEARRAGIYPLKFTEIKEGEFGVKEGYMGLLLLFEDKKEVMPVIESLGGLEYDVTSKIKRLTSGAEKMLCFAKGQDEVKLNQDILVKIRDQYGVKDVDIETEDIPPETETFVLLGPKKDISKEGCKKIDSFIKKKGGKVFFALNRLNVNLDYFFAMKVEYPNLDSLLLQYGLKISDGCVMDRQNQMIGLTMKRGMFRMQNFVPYPFFPKVTNFNPESPITRELEAIVFPYPAKIEGGIPIAYSSKGSWLRKDVKSVNPMDREKSIPFALPYEEKGPFALASIISNDITRMVITGTSKFIEPRYASAANYTFLLNAIDWLMQDESLIAIRSKGISDRPLTTISKGKKRIIRYIDMLLPSFILIGVGIVRWRRRRK